MSGEEVDLYDAGACTFLGTVAKSDIRALIDTFAEMPEQGSNDIYVETEWLDLSPDCHTTMEFAELLNEAFKQRDYLVLRWMPWSHDTG